MQPTLNLNFQKMHANGDDFVIVDSRNSPSPMTSAMARRMGDRNRGVGFNQLAVLLDCDDADARVMFWNADGSALDVCGSATRGAADLLMREAIALGSGSCSCGAVVNGIRRGLLDSTVEAECDGGNVTVQWDGVGSVFLIGPVEASFSGTMSQA
jgi:diaminopimelate epimerase